MSWLPAGLEGFALGLGLIVAIGAQNAFILRQGLIGRYVLPLVLFAATADAVLILAGVLGLGRLIAGSDLFVGLFALAGASFLAVYAVLALRRALRPESLTAADRGAGSLKAALATLAAVTLLNPHVYIDTLLLFGSVSTRYEGTANASFAIGGMLASLAWFSALGFGARFLAPLFRRPAAWRVLDLLIAAIMALIAWQLAEEAWARLAA